MYATYSFHVYTYYILHADKHECVVVNLNIFPIYCVKCTRIACVYVFVCFIVCIHLDICISLIIAWGE